MRHLVHMASFSAQTNMHARNLAIVWAPNLLRWVRACASWQSLAPGEPPGDGV